MSDKAWTPIARSDLSAILAATAGVAAAEPAPRCNHFIHRVPHEITAPGQYCLARNVALEEDATSAITISSNDVVLDLNAFTVENRRTPQLVVHGIASFAAENITIRNGVVLGFHHGITLLPFSPARNLVVEDVLVDRPTTVGINVGGHGPDSGLVVRNNVVRGTGLPLGVGIAIRGGGRVIGNDVLDMSAGIALAGEFSELAATPIIASGNRTSGGRDGFICAGTGNYLTDNIAIATNTTFSPECRLLGTANVP